ncbi:MAG: hypothetical protein DSY82_06315 [Flavobacteriia bacterium]|nr:MAG: hypothetical protein DSY82_06315 [Flavobacteriia bacterium]
MSLIVHPTYFSPVIQYVAMVNSDEVIFEKEDHYQKQTYRNRCYIYGANGKQILTVPVLHKRNSGHPKTRDIRIDNSFPWQVQHLKSIQTAYRSSPFFEYYEDDLIPVFKKKFKFLIDLNLETDQVISELLDLEIKKSFTETYIAEYPEDQDYRSLVNAKTGTTYDLKKYQQVFMGKHGFISNLSILDLLFNEGTNALGYLLTQNLNNSPNLC